MMGHKWAVLLFFVLVGLSFGKVHKIGGWGGEERDKFLQPFASNSIWNLPIGKEAVYVFAGIKNSTEYGMTTDQDIIILEPTAPITSIYYNGDAWTGRNRCSIEGDILFTAPIPADLIIGAANKSWTPNYAGAVLQADNNTVSQGQPFTRCTLAGPFTSYDHVATVYLNGNGTLGAHGGSGLSSIGGTIRVGELLPNSPPIRHALKINLYAHFNYYRDPCFRFPAVNCDGYASTVYNGTNPSLKPGSLLALNTSVDIDDMGLETEPAKMLAWTFQNYGAYIVDDTFWNVYAIEIELGPNGDMQAEFEASWGFTMTPQSKDTPWSRDMDRIYLSLSVVDSWDETMYEKVAASNGTLGAGGGPPLQPWAPPVF